MLWNPHSASPLGELSVGCCIVVSGAGFGAELGVGETVVARWLVFFSRISSRVSNVAAVSE